jgi:hypothetical protein
MSGIRHNEHKHNDGKSTTEYIHRYIKHKAYNGNSPNRKKDTDTDTREREILTEWETGRIEREMNLPVPVPESNPICFCIMIMTPKLSFGYSNRRDRIHTYSRELGFSLMGGGVGFTCIMCSIIQLGLGLDHKMKNRWKLREVFLPSFSCHSPSYDMTLKT